MMNVTVTLPDDIATRLAADGADLARQALEALAAEGYRAGRLTRPDLRQLLGFETGHEIDGFLKRHDIYDGITLEELNRQMETLDRLGL
jgi:Xaa-Pro aminopeptidase